ncbi:hypothetical protein Q8A73_024184, partial [Channa argus]
MEGDAERGARMAEVTRGAVAAKVRDGEERRKWPEQARGDLVNGAQGGEIRESTGGQLLGRPVSENEMVTTMGGRVVVTGRLLERGAEVEHRSRGAMRREGREQTELDTGSGMR